MAGLSLSWILRSTLGTVLTLLCGVGLLVPAAVLLVTVAPGGDRDLRLYEAAPRCPSEPSADAECRWTQEFTVVGVRLSDKRGRPDRVVLRDADGARWESTYPSRGPLLEDLDGARQVTGTIWRGKLTEIATGDASQRTSLAPEDLRTRTLILALIVVPTGLLMTAASAWLLLRRATPGPTPGMAATLGLAFGLLVAGLLTPLVFGQGKGENVGPMAAVWLPIAAIMTIAAFAYVTRKRSSA
jgi:hypothetical protein